MMMNTLDMKKIQKAQELKLTANRLLTFVQVHNLDSLKQFIKSNTLKL